MYDELCRVVEFLNCTVVQSCSFTVGCRVVELWRLRVVELYGGGGKPVEPHDFAASRVFGYPRTLPPIRERVIGGLLE